MLSANFGTERIVFIEQPYPLRCSEEEFNNVNMINETYREVKRKFNSLGKVQVRSFNIMSFFHPNGFTYKNSPSEVKYYIDSYSPEEMGYTEFPWTPKACEQISRRLDRYLTNFKEEAENNLLPENIVSKEVDDVGMEIENAVDFPKNEKTIYH